MAEYWSPGVYVEEVPPSSRPIPGVGTSTAGFLGVVANDVAMPDKPDGSGKYVVGDASTALLVTSWNDFVMQFGDIQARNAPLSWAVFGFFHNGGTRCWVVRVAQPADLTTGADELNQLAAIDE